MKTEKQESANDVMKTGSANVYFNIMSEQEWVLCAVCVDKYEKTADSFHVEMLKNSFV